MTHEPPERREALRDECGETDGYSFCTNQPGHGPVHWDRHTKHEWHDGDTGLLSKRKD